MLPNSGIATWSNGTLTNCIPPLQNLDELPRLFSDFRIEGRVPKPLCDIEEEKAERALHAIEDAIDTLRVVLNDVFRKEDGDSAGENRGGG
jgi:hypothetical protein